MIKKNNWMPLATFAIVALLLILTITRKQSVVTNVDGTQSIKTSYGLPKVPKPKLKKATA